MSENLDERMRAAGSMVAAGDCSDAAPVLLSLLKQRALTLDREAQIRFLLSEVYESLGFPQQALEAISKYESIPLRLLLGEANQIRALVRLGKAWDKLREQPKAIGYLTTALKLAQQVEDKEGIGLCYLSLGRAYRVMDECTIATDCLDRALEQFRVVGNRRALAQSYRELGLVEAHEGNHEWALGHFAKAEALIKDQPDYFILGTLYLDIGALRAHQTDSAGASGILEKAYDYFAHSKHRKMIAHVCSNLGLCLISSGDWPRAEQVLQEALRISREFGERRLTAHVLDNLAQLLIIIGRTYEAKEALDEGLGLLHDLGARWVEVQLRLTYTKLLIVTGELTAARKAADYCLQVSEEIGDAQFVIRSRLLRVEVYLELSLSEEAEVVLEQIEAALVRNFHLPSLGLCKRYRGRLALRRGHSEVARQEFRQSLSVFESVNDTYQVALARVELDVFSASRGERESAGWWLEGASAALEELGAVPDLDVVRAQFSPIEDASRGQLPGEEIESGLSPGLVQRVIQGSVSRELLVAEILNLTMEASRVGGVLLCRKGKAGDALEVLGAKGTAQQREKELLATIRAEEPDRRSSAVFHLCPRLDEGYVLVLDAHSELPREIRERLEPLLKLFEQEIELAHLRAKPRVAPARSTTEGAEFKVPGFIHSSAVMERLLEQIHKIRSSSVTVLITGESGTGKELVARAIHAESARSQHKFVPFNCTATTKELVDSQLFGYRRGAFTGAVTDSPGIIRAVEHGTLFLDEIGDLALEVQPKLLRFLQEGEIQPLGEKVPVKVDVRVIAATNSDLEQKVAEGLFREDLFHRLNVIRLQIPPLRERRDEVPLFIDHFLSLYSSEMHKSGLTVAEEAIDLMVLYDWPGNVRQLSNEIRRMVAMAESQAAIGPELLTPEILHSSSQARARQAQHAAHSDGIYINPRQPLAAAVSQLEKEMVTGVLSRHRGNITQAASELGLSRQGLYIKVARLGLE